MCIRDRRSPAQCTEAAADQTVLTALMEWRALVATPEDCDALRAAIAPERVWPAAAFFRAKVEEQRQRHARFGDTADNLEPNLKDGPCLLYTSRRVIGAAHRNPPFPGLAGMRVVQNPMESVIMAACP